MIYTRLCDIEPSAAKNAPKINICAWVVSRSRKEASDTYSTYRLLLCLSSIECERTVLLLRLPCLKVAWTVPIAAHRTAFSSSCDPLVRLFKLYPVSDS
jgi:hypothetical protein